MPEIWGYFTSPSLHFGQLSNREKRFVILTVEISQLDSSSLSKEIQTDELSVIGKNEDQEQDDTIGSNEFYKGMVNLTPKLE